MACRCTKCEDSNSRHSRDINKNPKRENKGGLGVIGSLKVINSVTVP